MSEEALTKIPGTTYAIKFGIEGKYYAIYLCRGTNTFKTKQLNILRGTSLRDLPDEIARGTRFLLDSEQIFLAQVIVDKVVQDLITQIPKEGQVFHKETTAKHYIEDSSVNVHDLISKSEERAEKKSSIEFSPSQKPKFDATAENIGKIPLKEPKPLQLKKPASDSIDYTSVQQTTTPSSNEIYSTLEEKISLLSTEFQVIQEQLGDNVKEIKNLKSQISALKKETKELRTQIPKPIDD